MLWTLDLLLIEVYFLSHPAPLDPWTFSLDFSFVPVLFLYLLYSLVLCFVTLYCVLVLSYFVVLFPVFPVCPRSCFPALSPLLLCLYLIV